MTDSLEEQLAKLRVNPRASAIMLDVDGTLAPIVTDPAASRVPDDTKAVLRALASAYGIVACVSGRRATEAKRLVGIEEIAYIGIHGIESIAAGEDEIAFLPELEGREEEVAELVASFDSARLAAAGVRLEEKGPICAIHWRGAEDPATASSCVEEIAARASAAGFEVHRGRQVIEVRPQLGIDKGVGASHLLARNRWVEAVLYAGDDATDADAFEFLHELAETGAIRTAVCVAITSDETPAAVIENADVVVDGVEEFAAALVGLIPEDAPSPSAR